MGTDRVTKGAGEKGHRRKKSSGSLYEGRQRLGRLDREANRVIDWSLKLEEPRTQAP